MENTKVEYAKCDCQHCGGSIEIPRDYVGYEHECPHCRKTTSLREKVEAVVKPKRFFSTPAERPPTTLLPFWLKLSIGGLILAFLIALGQAASKEAPSDAIGGLAFFFVAIFALVLSALWLILPFVIYYGFRDIKRTSEATNDLVRGCLHNLQELTKDDQKP